MADDVVTVLDRLARAGLSREAIDRHLAADSITVDGHLVTDLHTPAAPPARVVLQRCQTGRDGSSRIAECAVDDAARLS